MPAVIFLVAELRRTSWKDNDPNAYRVVLIEAGHIAQNMMLACANNNLTTCPTAALTIGMFPLCLGSVTLHKPLFTRCWSVSPEKIAIPFLEPSTQICNLASHRAA